MVLERVLPVGRQLLDQLGPPGHREGRRDADVLQVAGVVVEPEQQRADDRPALVPAEPGDHAVRRPHVLDLGHQPLVRAVGQVGGLGDDAVEAGALERLEPALRGRRRPG